MTINLRERILKKPKTLLKEVKKMEFTAKSSKEAIELGLKELGLTQEALAKRIGKSRTHVTNMMRLLNLPEELQNMVLSGELSMGHVRPLITLEKDEAIKIARRTKEENLSVREVENIVKGLELQKNRKNKPKPEKNDHYAYAEGLLRKKYRTKVKIEDNKIDLIVLAGFMCILSESFTKRYPERIINVHPSLIPSFSQRS